MRKIIYSLYNNLCEGKYHIGFLRFIIRLLTNALVYFFYYLSIPSQKGNPKIIISLTSFPARIEQLWKVITILMHQQTTVPFKIILWLSKEQFDDYENLPNRLKKLTNNSFEIRLVSDDLKPHKKYYYAFGEYPEHIVITVDDDILYSLNLIQTLYNAHLQSPEMVCCCRGREVAFDSEGNVCNYEKWKIVSSAKNDTVGLLIVPTGIGGVLYPPYSYSKRVFDREVFKETCLNGDDLWLNFMCRQQGTCIKHVANNFRYNTLFFSKKSSLSSENVKLNRNDEQIRLISDWAKGNLNCDFFYNMN